MLFNLIFSFFFSYYFIFIFLNLFIIYLLYNNYMGNKLCNFNYITDEGNNILIIKKKSIIN